MPRSFRSEVVPGRCPVLQAVLREPERTSESMLVPPDCGEGRCKLERSGREPLALRAAGRSRRALSCCPGEDSIFIRGISQDLLWSAADFLELRGGFPSSRTFSSMGGTGYGNILCLVLCVGLSRLLVCVFLTLVCRAESEFVLLRAVMGGCTCWLVFIWVLSGQLLFQHSSAGGDKWTGR